MIILAVAMRSETGKSHCRTNARQVSSQSPLYTFVYIHHRDGRLVAAITMISRRSRRLMFMGTAVPMREIAVFCSR